MTSSSSSSTALATAVVIGSNDADKRSQRQAKLQGVFNSHYVAQPTLPVTADGSSTPTSLPPPPPSTSSLPTSSSYLAPLSFSTTPPLAGDATASISSSSSALASTSPILPPPPLPAVASNSVATGGRSMIRRRQLKDDDDNDHSRANWAEQLENVEPHQVSRGLWNCVKQPHKQSYPLNNFSLTGFNTIQLKLTLPKDLNTPNAWSFNIAPNDDFYSTDILFHFNPRNATNEVILNDRIGTWGDVTRKVHSLTHFLILYCKLSHRTINPHCSSGPTDSCVLTLPLVDGN
jgi:hypothetical protein